MNQPLGDWAGHAAEIRETLDILEGGGPAETIDLTLDLAGELGRLLGIDLSRARLTPLLASGAARERFVRWAVAQGATAAWFDRPELPLAPREVPIVAARAGVVARVRNRQIGLLLAEAGGARQVVGAELDHGIAIHHRTRLGRRVEKGEELARVYLRRDDPALAARFTACYEVADAGEAPPLVHDRVGFPA
jgi:thymidine phosphorylase